jgi:hypothetical protein
MTEHEQPGWRVTGPDGVTVQQAEGPTAANLTATSDSERSGDDGSDRSGSGE